MDLLQTDDDFDPFEEATLFVLHFYIFLHFSELWFSSSSCAAESLHRCLQDVSRIKKGLYFFSDIFLFFLFFSLGQLSSLFAAFWS